MESTTSVSPPTLRLAPDVTVRVRLEDPRLGALAAAAGYLADQVGDGGCALDVAAAAWVARHPEAADCFDGDTASPYLLRDELLHAERGPVRFEFVQRARGRRLWLESVDDPAEARALGDVLPRVTGGAATGADAPDDVGAELLEALLADGYASHVEPPAPRALGLERPGLHRLQHASLLFRSEHTGVITDPHFHSFRSGVVPGDYTLAEVVGHVDGVLLSHSHDDHLDWATLLQLPRDLPIVVPRVPRGTLLCPAIADELRAFGFTRVLDPAWFSAPVRIGDVEVLVLPFYGEQPLRDEAALDPTLRNWGNTYLVRTPGYSAWVLIDSGRDARGDMAAVARRVRDAHGAPDLVLSNLREFALYTPLAITGEGHYWWALGREQMLRWKARTRQVVTLGPAGVAEVCAAAGARYFLPYAHWWAAPGAPVGAGTAAFPFERDMVAQLAACMAAGPGGTTQIVPWSVGCRAALDADGRARVAAAAGA